MTHTRRDTLWDDRFRTGDGRTLRCDSCSREVRHLPLFHCRCGADLCCPDCRTDHAFACPTTEGVRHA